MTVYAQKSVEKPVDNCVYNLVDYAQGYANSGLSVEKYQFINKIFQSYPWFFLPNKYKLVNFAPDYETVDNSRRAVRISPKIFTSGVEKIADSVYNGICKLSGGKFSTYSQHIIIVYFFFKEF